MKFVSATEDCEIAEKSALLKRIIDFNPVAQIFRWALVGSE